MNTLEENEKYADFTFADNDRRRHRTRNRNRPRPQQGPAVTPADLTDFNDSVAAFVPSYAAALDPLHHERQWVIDSVGPFYQLGLLTDVTHIVKGGKEANVYGCTGHPSAGHPLLAAKLYRPRMLRHLKNDALYKAGRILRDEEGKLMKGRRVKLALRKKTTFGLRVDIEWWIGNEYGAQQRLYAAGADVPEPLAHSGTAILMGYVGEDRLPAPHLHDVTLDPATARPLFDRVLHNVDLMLSMYMVHGDLSAYNILYWDGVINIIDFPQLVDARENPHAFELLWRDIQRVIDYFSVYGIAADARALAKTLWQRHLGEDIDDAL